jgi:hypothetical protein
MSTKIHNLLDEDVPYIPVKPLKPTKYKLFKEKVSKIIRKNANKIADWILNLKPKIITKVLPPKVAELIELSKKVVYSKKSFWLINQPHTDETIIKNKLKESRFKEGKEKYSKYLQMKFYNNIKSLDDIKKYLLKTYENEDNAFKLSFSFGYVTEKYEEKIVIDENTKEENDEGGYKIKLFYASKNYYNTKPKVIRNRKDMDNLVSKINAHKIIRKLTSRFQDSGTRLIGVYSMGVKVVRLDFPIGSKVKLPDYIKNSPHILGLENTDNNMCFWACLALADGARRDRFITKAKKLFNAFYDNSSVDEYEGFDYVNELDRYEKFNTKYAINIVKYYEDSSIEYVRKSKLNSERTPLYLNLYLDHFSYIPSLEKLAKMYICNRCDAKFDNNFNLERHIDTCQLEQNDVFVKYPEIYEKKRNDIVELCDWFDVDCDYKHDYLITFDLEAMVQKVRENKGEKLKFVANHLPVSVSIATNVPGFCEAEHFILRRDPFTICKKMFQYFDKIAEKSEKLMKKKMKPLIKKVKNHYNDREKENMLTTIENYCSNIPIVGFNSSFYDINLMTDYGFMKEIVDRDESPFVIKSGTRYKVIKTTQFTFLDQMSYCAPGTSLQKFIKAYDIGAEKGYFPYEWFDSYEKLDFLISDLKIEDFNSSLKCTKMKLEDFNTLMQTCRSLNLIYVKDLLKWYNNLDVGPMLKACLKQKEFYYTFNLDMYKDGFSLPGLSENILFQFSQEGF